jgi:two-component system cell cycle sensor histidine kinase/response regulator CckA
MRPVMMPAAGRRQDPDFRTLFEAAPGLYLVLTPALEIVAVSDAYARATMTRREDILGRGLFDVFPDNPDDPTATGTANLRGSLDRVLRNRTADAMALQKYDIRRPEAEGGGFEERYWSPLNSPVLGPSGEVDYIIHEVEDVTEFVRLQQQGAAERKVAEELRTQAAQMEQTLQATARYRALMEQANDAILIMDLSGRILEANREAERLFGRSRAQITGRNYDDFVVPEEREDSARHRARLSSEGTMRVVGRHMERAGGTVVSVDVSGSLVRMGEESRVLAILRDVTERQRLEALLLQSQKMESVGRLAGGVAHDFNNLLGVITGYGDLLLREIGEGHPSHKRVVEIRKAADRAAALTRQLLAFSRKQVLHLRVLDLNGVVSGIETMLRRLIGEHIELITVLYPRLGRVKADPGQIEQVIANLTVNARDAMPNGGKLILETGNVELDDMYAAARPDARPGPHVMLAVSDTGHGMDAETLSHMFEPFFTTKGLGQGTGLGLATVYGIVRQVGGQVMVYSEPGRGTSFKIYLPRLEAAADEAPASAPLGPAPRGTETVLLVEDESALRILIHEVLTGAGYRVLQGGAPDDALAVAAAHQGVIHLVLTDVILPSMSGRQMADALRAVRPETRTLFMSGYTDDAINHHGILEPGMHFLEKPFTSDALLRKVREVLDGGQR